MNIVQRSQIELDHQDRAWKEMQDLIKLRSKIVDPDTFGGRMRIRRIDKWLRLRDLNLLTGVEIKHLSNIECNKKRCNIQTLEKICRSLECTATDLLGF
jgi:DNA-binding Xre family transcriptional regulator